MGATHPLKAFRESQTPPLTQDELATRLGVSKAAVSRWETGARKVDEELLAKVARITGIAAAKLRPDLADLFKRRAVA
jgi:transcriptional regulator with XRE-family HTH domain